MARKRRSFTKEFKVEAVRLVREGATHGKSAGQIAKDLDLTETSLRAWVRQADVDQGKGPTGALTTTEREELSELRRENKVLRMEREILKKSGHLLREGELVKFDFIEQERVAFLARSRRPVHSLQLRLKRIVEQLVSVQSQKAEQRPDARQALHKHLLLRK